MSSLNKIEDGGVQGGNFVNSTVNNSTFNISQSDKSINISKIIADYKNWVLEKKEKSEISRKLKQLVINGENCHIKRNLRSNVEKFSADDLLNKIPPSDTLSLDLIPR